MGIMDFFRKKQNAKEIVEIEEFVEVEPKEVFVPDISMLELESADWVKFAGRLKQNRLLPNSYVKKPTSVDVGLDVNNRPLVKLTYSSATSTSIRQYLLFQDGIFEYVNGVWKDRVNEELNALSQAMAYEGGTNITQDNDDLPFDIVADTLEKISS